MTVFLFTILAQILDPIRFFIILILSFFLKSKWIIPVSAISGSIITETILTMSQITRIWGSGLPSGLVASFLHALICYAIVNKIKKLNHNKNNS